MKRHLCFIGLCALALIATSKLTALPPGKPVSVSGSQVWTNDTASSVIFPTSTNRVSMTNQFWLTHLPEDPSGSESAHLEMDSTNDNQTYSRGFWIRYNGTGNDYSWASDVELQQQDGGGPAPGQALLTQQAFGAAVLGSVNPYGTNNGGLQAGVAGWGNANAAYNVGVLGFAAPGSGVGGRTNIGVYGLASDAAHTDAGAMFGITAGTDEIMHPQEAALIADSFETGAPVFIGRTNNGTTVFKVDKNGTVTANQVISQTGFLVHSNTLASIPTLAKGDNYYWSSNGVAFVICSGPTGTLTTNHIAP